MKKITLTQGQVATIDDEDAELVNQYKWFAVYSSLYHDGAFVAVTNYKKPNGIWSAMSMHWFLMQPPTGLDTDHRDRNTLNNQRSNLRIATRSQNLQNRGIFSNNKSGYKGVYFDNTVGRYKAEIRCNRVKYSLGYHRDPKDAARAYNEAATRLHGEFAVLNAVD